ncbi:MAG: hypothetical protein E7321_03370 [Clostridiales bacterium]|nr:hypothetical protein [Clostridiales bacterium]
MQTLMQPVIMPVQEFSQCLKQILAGRKISASELARMMAYKSRNSIFRILDEKGGHSARQAFYDRLTGEDPLDLSEQERQALGQALEVSRVGEHVFMSNRAMRELLMSAGMETEGKRVRIDAFNRPEDPGFHMGLAEMARNRKAYIAITGCCDRAIFNALRERIYKTDVTCDVKVTHLIYTGEEEIVNNISAIQPLLYCDFYTAYCVEPGVFGREREALYRQNCIHVQTLDQDGTWYWQSFALADKGVFIPLGRKTQAPQDCFSRYFAEDLKRMPLLKAEFSGKNGLENYLSYTESCRKLEMNRAIYTIKLDVPFPCIHPDILLPCVQEDFWNMAGEKAAEVKAAFRQIHLERWENIFEKKKSTHIICSQEAMARFARSGRLSDHVFVIRTYTPRERVQILMHLRAQARENPNFSLYFFKAGFEPMLTEIGLYEGEGTLINKPYTHYDLAGDHAEAIIAQKEFCQRYKEFFIKDLLERSVISQEETLAYMDALIEMAQKA